MGKKDTILEIKNMYKDFGPTIALNGVSFEVCRGEIRGLIGENGSGKSTISSIVAGIQTATKGEMFFKGNAWKPENSLYALENGVGMIVQEAGTIPNISVAENIFLGHEEKFAKCLTIGKKKIPLIIDKKKMNEECQKLFDDIGIKEYKPDQMVSTLDLQARKIVEIAKCLYWNPDLLIVDETTTALSLEGREFLYKTILRLRKENKSVLLISHDLDEMCQYCDVLTVLRDGNIIGTVEKKDYDMDIIRKMMVGREVKGDYYRNDNDSYSDEVVLKADCITTMDDLLCFSLELHKGEILGIGELSQCGMRTVGKAIFGLEKVLDGKVTLANGTVINSPYIAVENQMAYISKDRDTESLAPASSIYENISSTGYKLNNWLKYFISHKKENKYVDKQIADLMIKCSSKHAKINSLSGGNKQKVAFGKWIACDAKIIIMDCPTRGVDVGVKAAMYDIIYKMKQAGKSIILISEELQELIGMSDRILIMKNGEVTHEAMRSEEITESKLIDYMI